MRYLLLRITAGFCLLACPGWSSPTDDPLAELKKVSHGTKHSLSSFDAHNISVELARPLSSDPAIVKPIADLLANEQMDWQEGRKAGLDEGKLLKALNHYLQLESAPEYLQLRPHELRSMRMNLWIEIPDLSTGTDRKQVQKGSQVIGSTLSPFEAYYASGLLVYQKLFNDDYVRTSAEEKMSQFSSGQLRTPGIHAGRLNTRRIEFQQRLMSVAKQWSTPDAAVKAISDLLKESRND